MFKFVTIIVFFIKFFIIVYSICILPSIFIIIVIFTNRIIVTVNEIFINFVMFFIYGFLFTLNMFMLQIFILLNPYFAKKLNKTYLTTGLVVPEMIFWQTNLQLLSLYSIIVVMKLYFNCILLQILRGIVSGFLVRYTEYTNIYRLHTLTKFTSAMISDIVIDE